MPWEIFTGTGLPAVEDEAWRAIPQPPPWRERKSPFVTTPDLLDAVNAALHLRRPLLLTGPPGSGKSTLASVIADEFQLGPLLEWHVTSRSTLTDALYQYDAVGRLHATQAEPDREHSDKVEQFVTLGPLGTALAARDHPRAVLIDEIDKSDLDLPGDLLHVLELGEFDVPPLVRAAAKADSSQASEIEHTVRGADREPYKVINGIVRRAHYPVIVLTSNGEQTFPPPFLRRCVRFEMKIQQPVNAFLEKVVAAHLGTAAAHERQLITQFADRLVSGDNLALDQLLNLVFLLTGNTAPGEASRARVEHILLRELSGH